MKEDEVIERKIITYLNFGSFPGVIQFSSGFTYDEIMDTLKGKKHSKYWREALKTEKEFIDSGKYFAIKREIDGFQYFFLILTDQFDFSDEHMIILAHEVLHLLQFNLPKLLNRDEETEAEAYTHSHIMRQCLNALRGIAQ